MQSLRQYDELVELKSELATVVEALDVLHDFLDSVFGAKFQSFCGSQYQGQGTHGGNNASSPREVLRDLRWKHKNNARSDFLRRSSSSSSSASQIYSHSSSSTGGNCDDNVAHHVQKQRMSTEHSPSFPNIERSEIIDVKIEVNHEEEDEVPDFLEDVDPFYNLEDTGPGGGSTFSSNYAFDGGETEMKYCAGYQVSPPPNPTPTTSETYTSAPDQTSRTKGTNSNPNRCIPPPGLIPICSDPLNDNTRKLDDNRLSSTSSQMKTDESRDDTSASTGSSELEWLPSTGKKPKNEKKKRKPTVVKKLKREGAFDEKSGNEFTPPRRPSTPNHLNAKIPIHKFKGGEVGDGGPFKCTMCPASYKQEDSLRSHQKYKHNPSRVQCTCHLCGKSMVDKYRLQRHLRLHTGEKPFECQYCQQSFYRKDYHTKHLQRKHGIGVSSSSAGGSPSTPTTKKPEISTNPFSTGDSTTPIHNATPHFQDNGLMPDHDKNLSCTPPTTPTTGRNDHSNNFIDYFSSSHSSTNAGSLSTSLMTMTSLTFDDLISADL